ncbi:TonB-dependent receptor [Zymomonas mobilis]|uniref:TonB-dependent receptor n=1 Tax=Zymomonas mobilis subsp. pomaceae (strain ATCC 29192 / DSM 22645 / JCM 10191 / CCUG 17912 / NBRC 13757 / NCIMB 11200 / NRRL B-4491 / Barker I) TaxID=579138 RepID=F8ETE6_ZYMMT|nr:TonB-dependent receptor [Zymomonas mobilis]AEI37971.1 TonB-dependent receptor [Zymomonas mobilis subsp. pomaceae ATCC 29192]MDX5949339.1 TonB-dependent receptor [Zymomonas mobilis subsp. pomaceae]GEB89929.1 TonB-dependent receptor [Zymomonas mobilis subsp. pomaceae]
MRIKRAIISRVTLTMLLAAPAYAEDQIFKANQTSQPLTKTDKAITNTLPSDKSDKTLSSENTDSKALTITAKRRFEYLQKVPIAETLLTRDQALKVNIHDIPAMFQFIPSANFRTDAATKNRAVFIRGIGTISASPGAEPAVSTMIDGVVMARTGQATVDLYDLDHLEVLKGPQGTAFGKNASAGVINITTSQPTKEFHGYGDISYFSGNEYRISGGVSGTLIPDKLIANASFLFGNYDGNVHNIYLNKMVNGYEHRGGRTKFVWTPNDTTTVTLGLDYMYSNDNAPNGIFTSTSQVAYPTGIATHSAALEAALKAEGITPSKYNTTISNDAMTRSIDHNGGASITIDQDLGGGYNLTSISAYRRWRSLATVDYDELTQAYPGLPSSIDHETVNFWQASEELRIASPKGHFFDYVAGFFYMHGNDFETYTRSYDAVSGSPPLSAFGAGRFTTTTNNYAIFGEGHLNFTKKFRAILGLRLMRDDISYNFNRQSTSSVSVSGIRPSFASSGSTANNGYTDRIGLQYDITRDIHSYFTYAHGYTGPAFNVFFNMAATDTAALKPETNDTYEIGLKTDLWDHRITANFAAFIENFSNYQATLLKQVAGGRITPLVNAGTVSSKGVEGDITVRPIRSLTLGGNFAYTHAVVDHFDCAADAPASCNIDGKTLPFSPRWKFVFSANYIKDITDRLTFSVGSNYTWQSRTQYSLTETPDTVQESYGIWNMNTSIEDKKNKLRLTLIIRNIMNKHYASFMTYGDFAGTVNFIPRDYGRYGGFTIHKDF